MTATPESWDEADSAKAHQIWVEYQRQHDLTDRLGQTAGIDPDIGRIWFGESVQEIVHQRDAEGLSSPLFFERVGSKTYYRKGSRRRFLGVYLLKGSLPLPYRLLVKIGKPSLILGSTETWSYPSAFKTHSMPDMWVM